MYTVTCLGRELCYLHRTHRVLLAWCLLKFNLAYMPWRHVNVMSRSPLWHNDTTHAPALSSILKQNNKAFSNTCYLEEDIKERRKRNPAGVIKGMNLSMQRSPSVTVSILTVIKFYMCICSTRHQLWFRSWSLTQSACHVLTHLSCHSRPALHRAVHRHKTLQQECVSRLYACCILCWKLEWVKFR